MITNDKYITSSHKVSINEIDPYNIVHHSCYFDWINIAQRRFLCEFKKDLLKDRCLNINDYITKYYNCKHITAASQGMDITLKTLLISYEDTIEGIVFKFKHLIFSAESNIKVAVCETEIFFNEV